MPHLISDNKQKNRICPHCFPAQSSLLHWQERLDDFIYRIDDASWPFKKLFLKNPKFCKFVFKTIFYNFFNVALFLSIFKEVEIEKKTMDSIGSHTLVVVKEATKRGISIKAIKFLGKLTNYFSIIIKGEKSFFEALPTLDLDRVFEIDFDDKINLKQILTKNDLPVPEGQVFSNQRKGFNYGKQLGFPLVVKPRRGTHSKHITANIKNDKDLLSALKIVKQISFEFIIEKFIAGNVFRATLVDNNLIGCCYREQANIIGDGKHSIAELIKLKNSNPLRGLSNQNTALHKILITEYTFHILQKNGLTLESTLTKGKKIYLGEKVILTAGTDIHDKTEEVHPINKVLLQRVAKICKAPLIGLDFICQDVSISYHKQDFAIIEANSLPHISMHHYPTTGKSRDVAGAILDYLTNYL